MMKAKVSIITPIYNGGPWIDDCFQAVLAQTALGILQIEVCVCNDASIDNTIELLRKWSGIFKEHDIDLHVYENTLCSPLGVGYGKNKAISISNGDYLCFQDVDDIMLPNRILAQYNRAIVESPTTKPFLIIYTDILRIYSQLPRNGKQRNYEISRSLLLWPDCKIIGTAFKREPEGSTTRYTKWANSLTQEQLSIQIYTSHGPTVIMPTWFCTKIAFDHVGGFSEAGKGVPEDLIFFYGHLDLGGTIVRVDECLVVYRYHENAATFSIDEDTIWKVRLKRLEEIVLRNWTEFTIWNAGKQGRKLYNSLSPENRVKVTAMCDVNVKQIGKSYTPYDSVKRKAGRSVKIVHFREARAPFVVCVKMDMTEGEFERNLSSLSLEENQDYILFS